ncbi:MAG: hypothetical protein ACM3PY_12260 [Omnitrophica WOR_2 bacterium]
MDANVYLSKIEEIVGAKFESNSIDLQFPRETAEEARLQKLKIVRMQKELGRIQKAVNGEIDTLKSTYEERKARVRPEGLAWLSYPSAKKSKEQQMARILQEESSALKPLKKVNGMIFAIQFSLDQIKRRLDSEIEQEAVLPEK